MQQTETYKLNLIETSDTFSPEALNENAQKIEAALSAARAEAAAATAAGDAALDQRVQVLELRKMVTGTYTGTGTGKNTWQIIELGFTPSLLVIQKTGVNESLNPFMTIQGVVGHDQYGEILKIVPNGFYVGWPFNTSLNTAGVTYYFFAIG